MKNGCIGHLSCELWMWEVETLIILLMPEVCLSHQIDATVMSLVSYLALQLATYCMMRPVAGIPLKNTLRNFGRMWRQSPVDMTENERLHLWDAAFAVAWQRERFRDIQHASCRTANKKRPHREGQSPERIKNRKALQSSPSF